MNSSLPSLFPCDVLFSGIQLGRLLYQIALLSLVLINGAVCLNFIILYHLLGHVTFVSYYIDDVTVKYVVTCCDLLRHVLKKSLITLNLIKQSMMLAKSQTSRFFYIKLH